MHRPIILTFSSSRSSFLKFPINENPLRQLTKTLKSDAKNEPKKQAKVIKNYHKINKAIFGELLESQSERIKKKKKSKLIKNKEVEESNSQSLDDIKNDKKLARGLEASWSINNFPTRSKVIFNYNTINSQALNKSSNNNADVEHEKLPAVEQLRASLQECQDISQYGEFKLQKQESINSETQNNSSSSKLSSSSTFNLFPFENPEREEIKVDENLQNSHQILSIPYNYSNFSVENSEGVSISFPSVTKVLNITMSAEQREILKKWEQKMIAQLGEAGFKAYKEELFKNGKDLHASIERILSGNQIEEIPPGIIGNWKSIEKFIGEIKIVRVLESAVSHPHLKYSGIVDCVAEYKGNLVVIDWKSSEKLKPFISNTYDTPLQIAAYVGAINYDPLYDFKVNEGLAVISYKDGTKCQLFHLKSDDIAKYWKLWLQRLKLYQVSV